jgi:hypothetical protein
MRGIPSAGDRWSGSVLRHPAEAAGWERLGDRASARARQAAARPYRSTAFLLGLNALCVLLFVAIGQALFGDPAELFRELMPGTWLSFAELLAVAVVAWVIHTELTGGRRLRLDSFWSLSVVVFVVFAFDEITQLTIFLADGLTALGALAPIGFVDMDAFLLTVLLLAAGAALLRYAREPLRYPAALAVLAVGVLLGAASQGLDSMLRATTGEFVAEESLKLAAEAFILGAYLVVLHQVLRRDRSA